ncbi:MAG: hypothetical protein CFE44_06660 [Burkholderiales bacterium PBB4]|nr:MAG: hypothetical protein CFE44_06660 [Burkholderiales bacterium PBB4]
MQTNVLSIWVPRMAAFVLASLAAASMVFWALKTMGKSIDTPAPAIASAQFLIDAVATAGQPIHPPRTRDERAKWLTELFIRLEKQGP